MEGKTLGIKIPEPLKKLYDNLTPVDKKRVREKMIYQLKRSIHEARFNPDAPEWRDDKEDKD